MDNPFYYGEEVDKPYFIDREKEVSDLVKDLSRGQNVIVCSARRYGKTSLIKQALSTLAGRGLLTFYVNLYAATSKKKFVDIYARAVALGTRDKLEKAIVSLKGLFPRMLPKITLGEDGVPEIGFDYDYRPREVSPVLDDLYEAVEKYAVKRKKRAVVAFDEFQEILNLEDEEIERSMRGAIQSHKKTAYVFLGSRRHMMQKLFNDAGRPFYKSGRMFPLGKIGFQDFSTFIKRSFEKGKIIADPKVIAEILKVSECHPYYTQMLCSVLWDRNMDSGTITRESIERAIRELIERESYTYTTIWDAMSSMRRLLLEALARGHGRNIYSQGFIAEAGLHTSSGIQKAVSYLEENGIIYRENGGILFSDMFFKQWILRKIV